MIAEMLVSAAMGTVCKEVWTFLGGQIRRARGELPDRELLLQIRDAACSARQAETSPTVAADYGAIEITAQSLAEESGRLTLSLGELPPTAQGSAGDAAVRQALDAARQQVPATRRYMNADLSGIRVPVVPPLPPADLTGVTLSGYTLERPIGSGGFGRVYLGRNVVGKLAAIKVPHHPSQVERVLKEAKALANLRHENIVALENVIIDHPTTPHLICEYVDGADLRVVLQDEGRLDERRCHALLVQILTGLQHAHEAGVLHLDLKPENIFITRATPMRAKILDFGIGRINSEAEVGMAHSLSLSESGIAGTPGYMAPEQRAGDELDARADLFALAVVLYEMLSGRRPGGNATLPTKNSGLAAFFTAAYRDDRERRCRSASEALRLLGSAPSPPSPTDGGDGASTPEPLTGESGARATTEVPNYAIRSESAEERDYAVAFRAACDLPEFRFLDRKTYSCGGNSREIARFARHEDGLSGLVFCLIPGGRLIDSERDVVVQPFLLCQTTCTWGAWHAACRLSEELDTVDDLFAPNCGGEDSDEQPVRAIPHALIDLFLAATSLRLPSESEWEYGCRAGSRAGYCYGEDDPPKLDEYAWYGGREKTCEVAQFKPNAFGLYDMHGNVWEWCADTWYEDVLVAPKDGGPATEARKVVEVFGGSPASRAGLEVEDLIVSVCGQPIVRDPTLRIMRVEWSRDRGGAPLPLEILRKSTGGTERLRLEVSVVLDLAMGFTHEAATTVPYRVMRGGDYRGLAEECHASARLRTVPAHCYPGLGFRPACSVLPKSASKASPSNRRPRLTWRVPNKKTLQHSIVDPVDSASSEERNLSQRVDEILDALTTQSMSAEQVQAAVTRGYHLTREIAENLVANMVAVIRADEGLAEDDEIDLPEDDQRVEVAQFVYTIAEDAKNYLVRLADGDVAFRVAAEDLRRLYGDLQKSCEAMHHIP